MVNLNEKNKWFIVPKPVNKIRLRIFCFPYAGGNASTYISWSDHLPPDIELVAIQPPGRANRIMEKPYDEMHETISALLDFSDYFTECDYIFFGHSLGSRMAYELASKLAQLGYPLPTHLIVSGSRAANLSARSASFHDLPDQLFINKLRELNGTPVEVLENSELLEFLLPLLRADFKISHLYQGEAFALDCPITVLAGIDDHDVTIDQLNGWEHLTKHHATIKMIEGGHFFIEKNREKVVEHVNAVIEKYKP